MISEESLAKFKAIYKHYYQKDISDQEALDQATKLVRLMQLIYKPITPSDIERLEKRRKELGL